MHKQITVTPKAFASVFFAVVLAASMAIPALNAYASPSDEKQAEAEAALEEYEAYQAQAEAAEADYDDALTEQLEAEAAVEEAQEKIEEKTAEIEAYQEQLGMRACAMYRSGNTTLLDVILGASTFEEFATTWNMLEMLNENDAELVAGCKEARVELEEAEEEAQEQAEVASEKVAECEAIAADAEAKAATWQATYESLSEEAQELLAEEEAAAEEAAAAEAEEVVAQSTASASSSSSSSNSSDSSSSSSSSSSKSSSSVSSYTKKYGGGSTILERAYNCIGAPYVYGTAGPYSFDCSGLVSYCLTGSYSHVFTSGSLMAYSAVSDPQPGDVCVRDGHCGIYIGNGQMIHAPQTGYTVCISSVQSGMKIVRP